MKLKAEKTGYSGFNILFGYDYKDGILQKISKEAEIVRFIYFQYLSGKSLNDIIKIFNSSNVPTKKRGFWAKKNNFCNKINKR